MSKYTFYQNVDEALQRPKNFMVWSGRPHEDDLFVTWSNGSCIAMRDDDLINESNTWALMRELRAKGFKNKRDYEIARSSSDMGGWVDHLMFRAKQKRTGKATSIYRFLVEWYKALEDYPLANEEDYDERKRLAQIDTIKDAWEGDIHKAENFDPEAVYWWLYGRQEGGSDEGEGEDWFLDNRTRKTVEEALRDPADLGEVSYDAIEIAAKALGMWAWEDDEEDICPQCKGLRPSCPLCGGLGTVIHLARTEYETERRRE